ncbi:MAG: tRNA pseudouridine(55) synthase TruB [Desulfobacteraceae bacterium]|nr:tRNA pseudouridine(55) synthase TruB [Desulfobacteraceae bacterium]
MSYAMEKSEICRKKSGIARAEDGVLVLDKPRGKTSADVVNRVKKLAGIYKAGHTGTLDPFATGVLICPVNLATRLSRFFLHGNKKYAAVLKLGVETDTMDCTGQITATHTVPEITGQELENITRKFMGTIRQVPPAYSALKHNGIPLYKYARQGKPVQKEARTVEIHSIRITRVEPPEIGIEVACSGGTYIRSLCADIGKELGCGAHVCRLVRTESCGFSIEEAAALTELEQAATLESVNRFIVPMAESLRRMPACTADAPLMEKIRFGRPISEKDLDRSEYDTGHKKNQYIKIVDPDNRLLAVIEKKKDKPEYSYCCVFQSN